MTFPNFTFPILLLFGTLHLLFPYSDGKSKSPANRGFPSHSMYRRVYIVAGMRFPSNRLRLQNSISYSASRRFVRR